MSVSLATTVDVSLLRLWDRGRVIVDHDEVDRSIKFVSNVLKSMHDHANVNRIELVYKGFEDCLREYEARFKVFVKEFKKACEKDSIEEYTEIVSKISGKHLWIFLDTNQFLAFKKELDSSEHMTNFLYHRFQATLSQNSNDSLNSSGINEIN